MDTISQYSLHDELLHRLRRMIIDGQFEPGDKIPEKQLCEHFDVSRTPLREALKVLAAEGLVELTPNRGAMVAVLTYEDFQDCKPITFALMSQCAELASGHAEDDDIIRLRDAQADLETARGRDDIGGMVAANRKIRETLMSATRSLLFKRISEALFFRMSWNALVSRLARLDPDALVIDCSKMAKALAARDRDALSAALHAHLSHVYEVCPTGELPCEITKRQRQE
jgi:DNA-binding GntR family transcriptional regulator